MNKKVINKLEDLIKISNKKLYYKYLKVLHLYKFFISNITSFSDYDKLEIITFFYESLLIKNQDIYKPLEDSRTFIFSEDKLREKNFRLALEYFRNRSFFNFNHNESITYIDKTNFYYSRSLINALKENSRVIEELFHFNEQLFRDSITTLENENDSYNIYSDELCDILVIKKNFFSDILPSFFSRDGLIIRFCDLGQVGFQKDSILLNEKEALLTKGIPLGNYKVLTKDIHYVTVHIKETFFKEFNIKFPNYFLKKLPWKLNEHSLKILNEINNSDNKRLIILRFISDIMLMLISKNNILNVKKLENTVVRSIVNYIDTHLEEHLSISFLQKEFGVNKNLINKLFKENYNTSPSKYILNKKLEYSALLLLDTDLSITEISSKLNFTNSSKFSLYFRSKYSLTPLQFKKKFKELISK